MNIPAFEQAAKALNASSAKASAVLADLKEAQRDLASPEECEARRLRLAASSVARQTRLSAMVEARRIRAEHGIASPWELLTELNSLVAAIDCLEGDFWHEWKARLASLTDELDEELMTPPPMPDDYREPRGEYDGFTQGVRGRGY